MVRVLAFLSLDTVLDFLTEYKYLAMFGILLLCGMGLPLPEEVTLIGAGLFVGWNEASFLYSSIACVTAILLGDSIVFFLGRYYGHAFLYSRPMRLFFSPRRQRKSRERFLRNGAKAVFFARFFAGIRIGVYAYAGHSRMSWFKFIFLDFLGAMISGPTTGRTTTSASPSPPEGLQVTRTVLRPDARAASSAPTT